MGMGIGAAMTGLRPIVEGMNMGFLLLAYNQISNNAGMLHYTSGGQFKVCCVPPPHMPLGCGHGKGRESASCPSLLTKPSVRYEISSQHRFGV